MHYLTPDEAFCDALAHMGERRRTRIKGYYICPNCDVRFILNRPIKSRTCPICDKMMPEMVATVDEFEVSRIKSWDTFLFEESDKYYPFIIKGFRNIVKKGVHTEP